MRERVRQKWAQDGYGRGKEQARVDSEWVGYFETICSRSFDGGSETHDVGRDWPRQYWWRKGAVAMATGEERDQESEPPGTRHGPPVALEIELVWHG